MSEGKSKGGGCVKRGERSEGCEGEGRMKGLCDGRWERGGVISEENKRSEGNGGGCRQRRET